MKKEKLIGLFRYKKYIRERIDKYEKIWKLEVIEAMQRLGRSAKNKELYEDIKINGDRDLSTVKGLGAIIRDTLERNSSDSVKFKK
ncbi:hypothetical protein [Staphylococcus sp. GDX8P80P]|uniref:hypothetical protein n=1 Tax=Staphylococcus sp. GDX8P80P TaxID=2804104 RepID=UPI001AEC6266|nr:hypothetical protein [Staphylococcus sp. GDX8P80P]